MHGYWLLFNALVIAMLISIKLQEKKNNIMTMSNPSLQCGDFDDFVFSCDMHDC